MQRYGDRGSNQASITRHAHTIPANPMSDRGQMVIEIYEQMHRERFVASARGNQDKRDMHMSD